MVELVSLQQQIREHKLLPFYVFIGEEIELQNIYLKQMGNIVRTDNVAAIYNKLTSKLISSKFTIYVVRDDMDFNKHLDYIHYNSVKHLNISPKDWEFSSFKKFVKQGFYQENWCNFDDKNDILNMNLE